MDEGVGNPHAKTQQLQEGQALLLPWLRHGLSVWQAQMSNQHSPDQTAKPRSRALRPHST